MKKAGVVLLGLGILVLAATVVWMTVGTGLAVKIPKGQTETAVYEGDFVFHVDPLTYRPLAPGRELRLPATIRRHVFTVDDQFSGDRAVIQEDVLVDAGIVKKEMTSVYVLDRKESYNLADERAYSWSPDNVQDRSGYYYPLFPMDMREGEDYLTWKAEIGKGAAADFAGKGTVEGIDVFMVEGSLNEEKLVPFYVETRGFPTSVSFEQLVEELKASGYDLQAMIAAAMPVMVQDVRQALEEAMRQPVPLDYCLTSYKMVAVEPTAGFPMVISDASEKVTVRPDYSFLDMMFGSMEEAATDPYVAPMHEQYEALKGYLASQEPQTVYTQTYTQTEESIKESADMARSNLRLVTLARVVVPAVGFTLGGLLLLAGMVLLAWKRGRPAAET